jgi:uncharacterized protein YkwD
VKEPSGDAENPRVGVRRAALLLAVAAGFLGTAESASAGPVVTSADKLRAGVITEMNRVRASHGLRALTVRARLQNAGTAHVRNLSKHGVFTHDWSNGTPFGTWIGWYWPGSGYGSWSAGENLFWAGPTITAKLVVKAWMASAGHRANLLNRSWRAVGVGAVRMLGPIGAFAGVPTAFLVSAEFGRRS